MKAEYILTDTSSGRTEQRIFTITGKKHFLEVLNLCVGFTGTTIINLVLSTHTAIYIFNTNKQNVKPILKLINRTKRSPQYLYK